MKPIPLDTTTESGREIVKALIEAKSERLEYLNKKTVSSNFFPLSGANVPWEFPYDFELFKFRLALPDSEELRSPDSPSVPEWNYIISPDEIISKGWQYSGADINDWVYVASGLIGRKPRQYAGSFKFRKPKCTCGFDAEGWRDFDVKKLDPVDGDRRVQTHIEGVRPYMTIKLPRDWDYIAVDRNNENEVYSFQYRTRRHRADCPANTKSVDEKAASKAFREALNKPAVEPFSLEEQIQEIWFATDRENTVAIRKALRKIVERINSLEGK